MQDLNDLYYFVQVVDHGGYASAGRALGMPKSKLSRRIIELLTSRHANEPGISEALFSLLSQMGLIRVDPSTGRPVMVVPSSGGSAMPGAEPAAAAAPASGLWTPEQASSAGEGKGKLWLPGME